MENCGALIPETICKIPMKRLEDAQWRIARYLFGRAFGLHMLLVPTFRKGG